MTMYRIALFFAWLLCAFSCQNHLPKQPQMLPIEMRLLDSIQQRPEWRRVSRFVVNIDNDSIDILGSQYNVTWDAPYTYYLELSAKDSSVFKLLDSVHINSIYEHLLAVLPQKNLQSITITLSYTYRDGYETEQAYSKSFTYSKKSH